MNVFGVMFFLVMITALVGLFAWQKNIYALCIFGIVTITILGGTSMVCILDKHFNPEGWRQTRFKK